jgi:phosphohistidine phosphatase SixA
MNKKCIVGMFGVIFFFLSAMAAAADTMIIVVRHAEKANDDPKDPNLNDAGNARAIRLATVLKDAQVKAVYVTQYKRTQQTAAPLALLDGMQAQVREVNQQNADTYVSDLLKEIKKKHHGETILIVGHSNTVPEIIKQLTTKNIAPIAENEYDRIYMVILGKKPRLVAVSYNP